MHRGDHGGARRNRWRAAWRRALGGGWLRRCRLRTRDRIATGVGRRTAGGGARCGPAGRRTRCTRSEPALEPRRRVAPAGWPAASSVVPNHAERVAAVARQPGIVHLSGRLEQFDRVAGGVVDQDLGAAGPGHDVVAELHSFSAEPLDLGRYVVDNEVDAVPAAWAGFAPVGHRAPGRAGRPTV